MLDATETALLAQLKNIPVAQSSPEQKKQIEELEAKAGNPENSPANPE